MIPILYAASETNFTHNGLGPLQAITSCYVTEERNGAFELEFEYPIAGAMFEHIQEDCIIKAKPNDTAANQLFRIYKSSKPLSGFVTFYGEHISYELSGNPIESVSVSSRSAQGALSAILDAAILPHNYEAQSDIETLNSTSLSNVSVRAALGGVEGSVLDVWGGEYEFDNFIIKLHAHRGRDTGIKIAYGKNLTDIKQEKSISEVYTAVYPYAQCTPPKDEESGETAEEIVVTLAEKIIYSENPAPTARPRVLMKDFTDDFSEDEEVTEERLRSKAQSYVNTSGFDVPSVNITVSFINLWQSPEYAQYALLERVGLCDTVTVEFPKLGISAQAKVIKTKYDTLKEKYISIELGNARSNFADTINQTTSTVNQIQQIVKNQSTNVSVKLSNAIAKATAAITGQSGGYVVLNPSENPQEILILDTPDIATAVNVWRWNSGGLGHSSTGYNGPYALAMTAEGEIVADFITAGTLKGELLEADSVQANAISAAYKSEVTNEITGAKNEVEQAFVAADEQLRSLIKTTSSSLSDDIEQTETKISQLTQTIDSLSVSFTDQYTGGINHIVNSSGLNGVSDDWNYTGSVTALQNAEAVNNTSSGSLFSLNASTLSQDVTVLRGKQYTLSCKARRDTENRCYAYINNGGNDTYIFDEQSSDVWREYTLTFTASGDTITLMIGTTGYYLYVADFMLIEGTRKSNWTPAPNEIYTTNVKIDRRGINITNSESATETIIDNTQFAVKHAGNTVLTVNKDLTTLCKTEVTDELTIGKGKFVPTADGLNFVLLD